MSNCNCVSVTDRWNHVTSGMSPFSSEKSFAAQVVRAVSESNHLNPSNEGQQSLVSCKKTLRAVARFVVASVGTFFASIIGAIYHSIKASLHLALALGNEAASELHSSCCSRGMKYIDRADEHLAKADLHGQAAAVDCLSLIGDIVTVGLFAIFRGSIATATQECAPLCDFHIEKTVYRDDDGGCLFNRLHLMQRV